METRTETGTWAENKTLLLAGSETVWATLMGGMSHTKCSPTATQNRTSLELKTASVLFSGKPHDMKK